MKKILSVFYVYIFIFSIIFWLDSYDEKVPDRMNPYAIIEFDKNLNMKVINPGKFTLRSQNIRPYEPLDLSKMSYEERERYFEEERIFKEAEEFSKTHPVTIVKIIPEAGMRVIYDGEGFIDDIIYSDN